MLGAFWCESPPFIFQNTSLSFQLCVRIFDKLKNNMNMGNSENKDFDSTWEDEDDNEDTTEVKITRLSGIYDL